MLPETLDEAEEELSELAEAQAADGSAVEDA